MQEKRMLGDYEVIHCLHIGDREIVVGDFPGAPKNERYLCMTCQYLDVFIKPEDAVVSDDYTEIIQEYGNRVSAQAEKTRPVVMRPVWDGIDIRVLTEKDCRQIDHSDDIRNQIVIINPSSLRREYQMCTNQIMLCTGGFGSHPNSRGNACYCIDLYTGEKCRQERQYILGTLERDQLPQWAVNTLRQYELNKEKERGER
jgi:hypothetical protein